MLRVACNECLVPSSIIVVSSENCTILKEYLPIFIPLMSLWFSIISVKNSATNKNMYGEMGSPCRQPQPIILGSDKKPHCKMYVVISVLLYQCYIT